MSLQEITSTHYILIQKSNIYPKFHPAPTFQCQNQTHYTTKLPPPQERTQQEDPNLDPACLERWRKTEVNRPYGLHLRERRLTFLSDLLRAVRFEFWKFGISWTLPRFQFLLIHNCPLRSVCKFCVLSRRLSPKGSKLKVEQFSLNFGALRPAAHNVQLRVHATLAMTFGASSAPILAFCLKAALLCAGEGRM
jgi:hypothetical protein